MSASSALRCDLPNPMPCPASKPTRSSTGCPLELFSCSAAAILAGCHASTLESCSPAVRSTAGYLVFGLTLCTASMARSARYPASFLTVPNSGMLAGPPGSCYQSRTAGNPVEGGPGVLVLPLEPLQEFRVLRSWCLHPAVGIDHHRAEVGIGYLTMWRCRSW